jgi:hypothetical protein
MKIQKHRNRETNTGAEIIPTHFELLVSATQAKSHFWNIDISMTFLGRFFYDFF